MDWQRKAIIVSEIKYWKDNRLLPEAYCDYLLALYTKGEEDEQAAGLTENKKRQSEIITLLFILLNALITPIVAFIIIYSNLNFGSIILLLSITFLITAALSIIAWKRYRINLKYILLVFLLNLFILTLIVIYQWITQYWLIITIIFGQLLLWIILGFKQKNLLLILLALFGFIIGFIAFLF
ncbi:hypothetical protein [Amphibacillus xylanus]|uniref:DUF2157 domain-containing protein n=1 Tax=Amphibacillus xylanus (strain ATCC 51415 / DSM 6626 / JCM 7361 / LMG 17667 / NBRC 15112 / Ep01) TaxID=698758 RepID=K0IXP4_AMPXN|nr:hypothetical protein [Amphibacillus xylanus]BAM47255.1 hypothetical protein AXY_11230 [Amphibacillus xylanus NBRC 15112]